MFQIQTFYTLIVMATWFYFVLLFIPQLNAQVTNNCFTPWNVTLQNPLHVKWDGEDRNTDVRIVVKPDVGEKSNWLTGCREKSEYTTFSVRELRIEPLCENTTHWLTASLVCEDNSVTGTRTFTIQTYYVEAPSNITIVALTNTSIKIEWNEPYSDAQITAYHVWKTETDFAVENIYHAVHNFYEFGSLIPYTEYSFVVRARTDTTFGPWSKIVRERTKIGVPLMPMGLTADTVTNSSIVVGWNEPFPSNGPILLYKIRWSKNSGTEFNKIVKFPLYKIDYLSAYTEYCIQVKAFTKAGSGPWSRVLSVLTAIGIPSVPTGLTALITTENSILVSWNAPNQASGPSLEYVVSWGAREATSIQVSVKNETEYLADGLKPYTQYVFQVAASTSAGFGHYTKKLLVRTQIGPPRELIVAETHDTSILLKWLPPEHSNGIDLIYIVKWVDLANNSANLETNSASCSLTNLEPSTNYSIAIFARTLAGDGPWSPVLSVTTHEKRPTKNPHFVLALVLGIMLPLVIILLIVGFIIARRKGIFDDFKNLPWLARS